MALSDPTLNERIHRYLKQQARYYTNQLTRFESDCEGCKSLYDSLLRSAGVSVCYTSIGLKRNGPRWSCPDCNRLIVDEDNNS